MALTVTCAAGALCLAIAACATSPAPAPSARVPDTTHAAPDPATQHDSVSSAQEDSSAPQPTSAPADGMHDAALAYRARITRWLSRGFQVQGSGLVPDQLDTLRVTARIEMRGRTVIGYRIERPSGNAAMDRAVRARLDSAIGTDIPPPPDDAASLMAPNPLTVTFACTAETCH